MVLNKEQQEQIDLQMQEHNHEKYKIDIKLSEKESLKDFIIHPNILRPEITTSQYLARWLSENKEIYLNKVCIDMGCGSGIQGIIMGLNGAKKVVFSDIVKEAIENTKENIEKFNLKDKSILVLSDLFDKIKDKADIIVFNHPFFPDKPIENNAVSRAMLDNGDLIQKFFKEAKSFLKPGGKIIMPYFHLGGETNNPAVQCQKHNYKVIEMLKERIDHGLTLQKGIVSIYELTI